MSLLPKLNIPAAPAKNYEGNLFYGGSHHNGDSFKDSTINYNYNINHSPSSATTSCGPSLDQAELNFQLLNAASTGQHFKTSKYLEKGAELEAVDEDGSNALHHAVARSSRGIAACLIEEGIDLNTISKKYGSAMLTAILRRDYDLVELLEESQSRKDLGELGTALHAACYKGDLTILQSLKPISIDARHKVTVNLSAWRRIEQDKASAEANLDDEILYDVTPIMLAARKGRLDVLRHFSELTLGRSTSEDSMTSLECRRKTTTRFKKSKSYVDLGRPAALGDVDNTGRTALMYAAEFGRADSVKFLTDEGSALDDKTSTGETALSLALSGSESGHGDAARLLLDAGACASYRDERGNTLLHIAVRNEHDESLASLAKRHRVSDKVLGKKSKSRRAKHANRDSVVALPKHCKDEVNVLDAINSEGDTTLLLAAKQGLAACVRDLVKAGASIDQTDADDWTPLIAAAARGHAGAVEVLLDHNANAFAQTGGGQTAMHKAAEQGHLHVLKTIIKREYLGPKRLNATDHLRQTPLHVAITRQQTKCVEALLRAGAQPNSKDRNHQTPWDIAEALNDYTILRLLNDIVPEPSTATTEVGSKSSFFEKSWNFMQGKGFVGGLGSQYGIGNPNEAIERPFTAVPAMETAITAVKLRRASTGLLMRVESCQSAALTSSELTEIFKMEL